MDYIRHRVSAVSADAISRHVSQLKIIWPRQGWDGTLKLHFQVPGSIPDLLPWSILLCFATERSAGANILHAVYIQFPAFRRSLEANNATRQILRLWCPPAPILNPPLDPRPLHVVHGVGKILNSTGSETPQFLHYILSKDWEHNTTLIFPVSRGIFDYMLWKRPNFNDASSTQHCI